VRPLVSGAARVAGVVGQPVSHSLSPLIHGRWIEAAGLDALYAPFAVAPGGFAAFLAGLRVSGMRGVNVTLPFKEEALRRADRADQAACAAGAANLLLVGPDGSLDARNTDGIGLLAAFAGQAPDWLPSAGPVLVLGAGGAARGAAAALGAAGARVRVVNRTQGRAEALAAALPGVEAWPVERLAPALADVTAVINATSLGLGGEGRPPLPFAALPPGAVVMDMVYKPLRTPLLQDAAAAGHPTVDGLAMLISQAEPSFEALFGTPPSANADVRTLALQALGEVA
jgi:shikimate dehydrogenase